MVNGKNTRKEKIKKLMQMLEKFHKQPGFKKAVELSFKYHTGQL